ncbi:hypothetical protein ACFTY8_28140 [Streptomyces mirabilis]|uniref:hypothetical protein n=1 Tax=Streptomyces mirabilis TaxID=68239 RepID=UPI00362E1D71
MDLHGFLKALAGRWPTDLTLTRGEPLQRVHASRPALALRRRAVELAGARE